MGIVFGISGCMNNHRLWKYFPEFYQENKYMLILATLGLSVPLIIRGGIDMKIHNSDSFNDKIEDHIDLFNALLFLVLDLIPIGFQLSSLIFGYIRKQKNKKQRLEVNHHQIEDS